MTKEILIILACVPLYVVNAFCDKYVSVKGGNISRLRYNAIKFLVGGICLLPLFLTDTLPRFAWGVALCGVACGVMYAISKTVILRGYEVTSVAFMTLCHAAGMILPCVLGHFFWSENMGFWSFAGILLAVVSVVMLKDSQGEKKAFGIKGVLYGAAVFLTSGGVMVVQKLMGLYFSHQSNSAYNFYSFLVAFLLISLCLLPKQTDGGEKKGDVKALWLPALGSALSLCIISLVMTSLAGRVPSVILFPLFNGVGIISVCIGSVFLFGEALTKKKALGLLTGVLGLCLVNI